MILERTIRQLDLGPMPSQQARERGELGYLQWLGDLPAASDYRREAMRAYEAAAPFVARSPAVRVFCDLLVATTGSPPAPAALSSRPPQRRGGARMRRTTL
ncbi:MAG: hypothetical protein AAGI51_08060 [Pseudomonadota bacterium]